MSEPMLGESPSEEEIRAHFEAKARERFRTLLQNSARSRDVIAKNWNLVAMNIGLALTEWVKGGKFAILSAQLNGRPPADEKVLLALETFFERFHKTVTMRLLVLAHRRFLEKRKRERPVEPKRRGRPKKELRPLVDHEDRPDDPDAVEELEVDQDGFPATAAREATASAALSPSEAQDYLGRQRYVVPERRTRDSDE